ncbi:ABC transporter permease [Candidatus Chloroploca sp. M-50]|uniref:ABC transporter permease n=1 Tax=Candidatus Chloroploca mongolica TaxID=2528176 RepID=A0ABS4D906_9CHLR|nr:ABC transporter permease [Candidatus Chloroploca mongolica]MBP1465916.1 ABC transporter permease [Candidatus Chloroploca mongolica]
MNQLAIDLGAVLAAASPLIFATMGALLSERSGVINLSLDGTIMLGAMGGFTVALVTSSVPLGFGAAALIGAAIALILCILSLTLGQSQTAVGFVLALLGIELSSFLGAPVVRVPGPSVPFLPIPLLADLPIVGVIFFRHNLLIYLSFLLVPFIWWMLFHTRMGLTVRALGERPAAAFARGVPVTRMRYLMCILGGALVGIAGAAYSLDLRQGWSYRHTFGMGWIALAIVIFGGWRPWRVAFGCYLFAALEIVALRSQRTMAGVPTQVFQVAPFVLMILVLALVNLVSSPQALRRIASLPPILRGPVAMLVSRLAVAAPAALGQRFERP